MLRLGKELMIFDGGMGSELSKKGLFGNPEELNVTHPEEVKEIHRSYSCADFITTNTFGLNGIKYVGKYGLRELAFAAVENARAAGKKVFFDVGPTGSMLAPLGSLSFDEAYNAFAEIADITKDCVDGYIAETFSDLYELKACVLALKEHANKPVFATMTFDARGRTLTGATPEIAVEVLEGLGVDALGANCSLGPKEMLGVAKRLLACSRVPVLLQPNRGLPVLKGGKTEYELSADEFAFYAEKFAEMGASIIGGCCGTAPEFIEKLCALRGLQVKRKQISRPTAVTSGTRIVEFCGVKVCGERLNPTGKPKLKEALIAQNYDEIIGEAVRQKEAGADILDINVGLPQLNEPEVMETVCRKVSEYADLPLQIDSSNPAAIERAVRRYNGIPLINSVNGEESVMAKVFPIAKKYGAVVLGLTMDGRGVPPTALERFEIAKKIIERAADYGIERRKIIIDTLVLTASAEQKLVKETLEGLRLVKSLGVKTALGVSNVSFGLPNRPLLNKTFLAAALACGLDMPIMNPLDAEMTATLKAFGVLSGTDENAEKYIAEYKDFSPASSVAAAVKKTENGSAPSATLRDCILLGLKEKAEELTRKELESNEPMSVVNGVLIPALDEAGKLYDEGKLFLPQLVAAAQAAKTAFKAVSHKLPKKGVSRGTVVLATVKGDVHDIGKNIVKVVAESYGYNVVDLGKDVPPEKVAEAYLKHKPLAVGLSALMTTTVESMEKTIKALRAAGCGRGIFVGGAVLSREIAEQIGADFYTKDALEFVKTLDSFASR